MNRRNFIKTAGVVGVACCGGLGCSNLLASEKYPTAPLQSESQLPDMLRIDICTMCQLNCPGCWRNCPPKEGGGPQGLGMMPFKNFKKIVGSHDIKTIELVASGEIFLNPDLIDILKFCHKKNISLQALGGVNGNTISDEVINALVDYGVKEIAFSIDGASQDVYSIYRRGGNLDTVINNIKKINARKAEQGSEFPKLTWKYVIFGHNVCEMKKARKMAKELNMDFSYADNWFVGYSPIAKKDLAFVEREKRSLNEHYSTEVDFLRYNVCAGLWYFPQINWNGRLMGCCINYWKDFDVDVVKVGLLNALNHPDYIYAKKMLSGEAPPSNNVGCTQCYGYQDMRKTGKYVT